MFPEDVSIIQRGKDRSRWVKSRLMREGGIRGDAGKDRRTVQGKEVCEEAGGQSRIKGAVGPPHAQLDRHRSRPSTALVVFTGHPSVSGRDAACSVQHCGYRR